MNPAWRLIQIVFATLILAYLAGKFTQYWELQASETDGAYYQVLNLEPAKKAIQKSSRDYQALVVEYRSKLDNDIVCVIMLVPKYDMECTQ